MIRVAGVGAAAALLLSGCGGRLIPPSADAPPPQAKPVAARPVAASAQPRIVPATPIAPVAVATGTGPNALGLGISAAPALPVISPDNAQRALTAFRQSCPALLRRADASGLTQPGDWQPACSAASATAPRDAVSFFETQFEAVQVGDGKAFATGYYEPEIAGSRTRDARHQVPIYRKPDDIVTLDLGAFSDKLKGRSIAGRVSGRTFVPYHDRTAIESGALAGRGLEIAWAEDPVELFFLQVQGSGRLRLPDGGIMRIGYDGQNGRDYTGIGKLMRDRGLIGPGQQSMQGIMAWLRANPEQGTAIMRENKSWVFFRELTGAGAIGALGVPVAAQASVATDPAFVPLGAPVFLSMDRADASGLWVAQDTGGAIKGSNRFDTFWGAGDAARVTAGGMSARGTAFVLLPRGTRARLVANPAP